MRGGDKHLQDVVDGELLYASEVLLVKLQYDGFQGLQAPNLTSRGQCDCA
jgi:hypothetical protein